MRNIKIEIVGYLAPLFNEVKLLRGPIKIGKLGGRYWEKLGLRGLLGKTFRKEVLKRRFSPKGLKEDFPGEIFF